MVFSRRGFGWGVMAVAAMSAGGARAADVEWPNVFISPAGQPFRAKSGAPYPVVDWFKQADKNGDGKLDRAEFVADAEAFFKTLDVNGDGVIDSYEVENYEHNIAPEVLGYTVSASNRRQVPWGGRLWLAQGYGGGGMGGGDMGGGGDQAPEPDSPDATPIDPVPTGAGPYELQEIPEPITPADVDFDGIIRKADFLALADRRFTALDTGGHGFLVLAKLPKTYAQRHMKGSGGRLHL